MTYEYDCDVRAQAGAALGCLGMLVAVPLSLALWALVWFVWLR